MVNDDNGPDTLPELPNPPSTRPGPQPKTEEEDWLERFQARCVPNEAPQTGEPLLAYRFVVCVEMPDGSLRRWSERNMKPIPKTEHGGSIFGAMLGADMGDDER